MNHIVVFGTLVIVLGLFIWGRIRHDLVALIALFILVVFGVIDPEHAFHGFGHPAVITVASVLVIGKALEHSGLIELLGRWVQKVGNNLLLQILALSALVAFASAFMNNVGALAIMMPIAIHISRKSGHAPSSILMPIAFASLLGGMTTLIGTPPNIIISAFRQEEIGRSFNMFDFTPVGALLTLAGILVLPLLSWIFLPGRKSEASATDIFQIDDYITEVEITSDSPLSGKTIAGLSEITDAEIALLGIVRMGKRIHAPEPEETLLSKDILILEMEAGDLKRFLKDTGLKLVGGKKFRKDAEGSENIAITEAVVMADSALIGRSAAALQMRSRYGANLLAVARRNKKIRHRLDRVIFQTGDVLLLQGREHLINDTIRAMGCLPLARRELRIGHITRIPLALGIFAAAIALVVSGLLPVQVAFTMAAGALVLTGVLPIKKVYTSIDWPIIVLLGAMIPVGVSLETSGGAELIAETVLSSGPHVSPAVMLALVMTITMLLSAIINNTATVVLMAPIAISVADGLGLSIDAFLMAVAVGGSSAFLTPIGHQSNTLVMGPGGYRFSDFLLLGLPISLLVIALGVPLIMKFWPI